MRCSKHEILSVLGPIALLSCEPRPWVVLSHSCQRTVPSAWSGRPSSHPQPLHGGAQSYCTMCSPTQNIRHFPQKAACHGGPVLPGFKSQFFQNWPCVRKSSTGCLTSVLSICRTKIINSPCLTELLGGLNEKRIIRYTFSKC